MMRSSGRAAGCTCPGARRDDSETLRNTEAANRVIDPDVSSAARVVYDHYGGPDRFPNISRELMRAVDQADSARYSLEEVLRPTGWVLLTSDGQPHRAGPLPRLPDVQHQLMMQLIDACLDHDIDEVLQLPDVRERVHLYNYQEAEVFIAQLRRCTTVRGRLAVVDLRAEAVIYAGNRFMVYALFPECLVSMHVRLGRMRAAVLDSAALGGISRLLGQAGGEGGEC